MSTTREKIEVMEAYEKGLNVYCMQKPNGAWLRMRYPDVEFPDPEWNWSRFDYKVVAEPYYSVGVYVYRKGDSTFKPNAGSLVAASKFVNELNKLWLEANHP